MRTVLNGPLPREVDDLLTRRRALGLDTYDEVWNGEYHMNPSPNRRHARIQARLVEILSPPYRRAGLSPIAEFNLGEHDNYRVPDGGRSASHPMMCSARMPRSSWRCCQRITSRG